MFERQNLGHVTLNIKMRRAIWNVVRLLLFRPFGTKLFRIWRLALLKMFGAEIDWSADVYASAKIWAPWNLAMSKHTCIGPDVIVYNQAKVTLEDDVCVSQYTYICTAGHESTSVNNAKSGLIVAPALLQTASWIGTRAFIGMGVTVGEHAIVGACACVFHDVAPNTIVGGNPAVEIKKKE